MIRFNISNSYYNKGQDYTLASNVKINSLSNQTKNLILDFTILWNLVECNIFNESFTNNYKNNIECDSCARRMATLHKDKIIYIFTLLDEYNLKHICLEMQFEAYGFNNSHLFYPEFSEIYNSDDLTERTKLLIYYCYRVRCNLFHGIKEVNELNNQNLLFFALNELMSVILKEYGYLC